MEKVKLGVYVSKELNEELNDLVTQIRNTLRMFSESGIDLPLTAINKSEIVEEILREGIRENRQKILDVLRTNLEISGLEEGAYEMGNSVELPSTNVYVQGMKAVLHENPEKGFETGEMYKVMAERLNLSEEQIAATMPKDGRNWHENRCQWARKNLRDQGIIEAPKVAGKGIWRLVRDDRDFS